MSFSPAAKAPFSIMTKPMGPLCNLDCKYCFYLEKAKLFPKNERFKMTEAMLENYVRSFIEAQPTQTVSFSWQGGEPTLAGVDFFKKAVAFQKKYANGKTIENAFQTNGTLLDPQWCSFLHEQRFLVGISVDGPEHLHDTYRTDCGGQPTWAKVMRGIDLCHKYGVEFNTLTVVNWLNSQYPLEVYQSLLDTGSTFLQFIPLVEREADAASKQQGLDLAHPPQADAPLPRGFNPRVTRWSVGANALGNFYCTIFDHWVRRDVGKIYVNLFDATLGKWLGLPGGPCTMAQTCGRALAMEHNGDLYACDHYVYPRYRLGNIMEQGMAEMADSQTMRSFGQSKRDTLPRQCRQCEWLFACGGDCPKHRFTYSRHGEYGLSYHCGAFMRFFKHSAPAMKQMADLYRRGCQPAEVMTA